MFSIHQPVIASVSTRWGRKIGSVPMSSGYDCYFIEDEKFPISKGCIVTFSLPNGCKDRWEVSNVSHRPEEAFICESALVIQLKRPADFLSTLSAKILSGLLASVPVLALRLWLRGA